MNINLKPMNYEKELYRRLEKLCDAINNDSQTLSNELELSRKLLISYKNKDERNLSRFSFLDLNIKTNKDTKHDRYAQMKKMHLKSNIRKYIA